MKTEIRKRKRAGANRRFVAFWSVTAVLSILVIFALILVSGTANESPLKKFAQQMFEPEVPEDYIPLYQEAANAYDIPWTLLAAHHRVETKFSAMSPLLSPAGAEGHLQFMPCTFVGWSHPTCTGLGKGEIEESEKTDPVAIQKYGGYGVDGNKDGIADPYNLTDALYSAANYLSQSGASQGELERAISTYNHSNEYVEDVLFYYNKYEEQFRKK
ncbi:lytic transglycosylase domain-containing protein [Planococcus sp. 107-1]|uniref:lytic transglycosylase domain-containing protein n=1 Tax=Planococcus sp. 107-1 TaxID=2908840 RepID=UPI001F21CF5C|nr:lytic transglycosylase domain-containing protein [Planococcus sp. 107-1]UJF25498.1 lytic transglycosylase domain-containing protein [Planococcus sp. 107-1]